MTTRKLVQRVLKELALASPNISYAAYPALTYLSWQWLAHSWFQLTRRMQFTQTMPTSMRKIIGHPCTVVSSWSTMEIKDMQQTRFRRQCLENLVDWLVLRSKTLWSKMIVHAVQPLDRSCQPSLVWLRSMLVCLSCPCIRLENAVQLLALHSTLVCWLHFSRIIPRLDSALVNSCKLCGLLI